MCVREFLLLVRSNTVECALEDWGVRWWYMAHDVIDVAVEQRGCKLFGVASEDL